jgi:hypothetical protein
MSAEAAAIVRHLSLVRADLSDEKRAQADLFAALTPVFTDPPVEREVRLGAGDVIDFMIGGVGIEVKLKGARKADVYRQLGRYARHDRVSGLILATNLSMGLPKEIDGKPAWFVSLGKAWL